ncbi:MAG TPA: type VI secretion system baseplate subunit TssG [Geminicoccaceae bacterium]|jgi:type VI secretion system protein ImpH|nr:type VI secretion system baseplate subunit TssG [Geminicoccaceae bacterium]
MAGADRTAAPALEQALADQTRSFDFFQALRLIERAHPERPRLGKARRSADDPIRLAQRPQLAFPPTDLAAYQPSQSRPARLEVLLMGLFGPQGPLPLHLTAYALDRRDRASDRSFIDFCDVFHHRLLCTFYRAWADARPHVQRDRPDDDRFLLYLGTLAGLGTPAARQRDALPDTVKLAHVGLLACQSRHPERLVRLLRNYFRLPVRIEEFVGGWLDLPRGLQCRLGRARARLGIEAVVGARSFQAQHRFRVRLGPLELATYERFLPGGVWLGRLVAAVRNAVGDELEWDVRLGLRGSEVPSTRLDGARRLGWTSWLGVRAPARDAEDLVLLPARAAHSVF